MPYTLRSLITKLRRRRRRSQEDSCVDSGEGKQAAVTEQLENLTLESNMDVDMAELDDSSRYQFGNIENYDFTFENGSPMAWPGPPYDEHARFAPGVFDNPRPARTRVKQRTPKRKLSQPDHGSGKTRSAKTAPDKATNEHSRARHRPIQYYGSPPPREEPLHLLTLPGEIRNQIYRTLCSYREPLIAQYKPIMLPRKGRRNPARITLRRFPREPILALGNVQLRNEVLSIFYGANKFLIRPTDHLDLHEDSLFLKPNLERWMPKWVMADFVKNMEVRFTVRLTGGRRETVNWTFRKLVDGGMEVEQESDVEEHCLCFDEGLLQNYRDRLAEREVGTKDLVSEVAGFLQWRTERLEADEGLEQLGTRFRPVGLKCGECGKDHLRALGEGL